MAKYNLTQEELDTLRAITDCEACGDPVSGRYKHIDHCHTTGDVRGILCHKCNNALGLLGDDLAKIQGLASYLVRSMSSVSAEDYEYPGII